MGRISDKYSKASVLNKYKNAPISKKEKGGKDMKQNVNSKYSHGGLMKTFTAPNGKESNLSPELWHLVRTVEFRNWFGDFLNVGILDKAESDDFLKYDYEEEKPLDEIKSGLISEFHKLQETEGDVVVANCHITHNEYSDIIISRKGLKKNFGYLHQHSNRVLFSTLDRFKEVLSNFMPFDFEVNNPLKKDKSTQLYYYGFSSFTVGDIRYIARIDLRLSDEGEVRAYNAACYDLAEIKEQVEIHIGYNPDSSLPAWHKDRKILQLTKTLRENVSKIVDANSEPIPVFHGTSRKFNIFNRSTLGELGEGMYFTYKKSEAQEYADRLAKDTDTAIIYEVFLRIVNPFLATKGTQQFWDKFGGKGITDEEATQRLIEAGHDGVILDAPETQFDPFLRKVVKTGKQRRNILALMPNQIKLADGSNTTFDINNPDIRYSEGGVLDDDKKEIYAKWKKLVNMSSSELERFYNSEEGKEAGLSTDKAHELGIHSGRQSARWILKMKDTPVAEWTNEMWEWAKRQIAFISRMSGNKGGLYDDKGNKTRKHTSLLIWGHNPKKQTMKYAEGGEAATWDKVASSSSRFRPKETITFSPPLVGKNGAKLISYTWAWTPESFIDKEGEEKMRRVSDWTQAELSADTGKNIVHQYSIEMPNGEVKTVSSESVAVLLGYTDRKGLTSFPNLSAAAKTLAKQKMQLAILEGKKKEKDDVTENIVNKGFPPIVKGKGWVSDSVSWKMGDAEVNEFGAGEEISEERLSTLKGAYIQSELKKMGINPYSNYGSYIRELQDRIKRQERKLKLILEQQDAATPQMKYGGQVGEKLILLRNKLKAPNMGSVYGQDVEPAGYYAIQREGDYFDKIPNYEVVEIEPSKPLYITVTDGTLVSWKKDLSEKYKAKGKDLSTKLMNEGYDVIITQYPEGDTGEIIVLDTSKIKNVMKMAEGGYISKGNSATFLPKFSKQTIKGLQENNGGYVLDVLGTKGENATDFRYFPDVKSLWSACAARDNENFRAWKITYYEGKPIITYGEFGLFGDYDGDMYDDSGYLKEEVKEYARQQIEKELEAHPYKPTGARSFADGGSVEKSDIEKQLHNLNVQLEAAETDDEKHRIQKQMFEIIYNQMKPEEIEAIKNQVKELITQEAVSAEQELEAMQSTDVALDEEVKELYEKEKGLPYGEEKNDAIERRTQIREEKKVLKLKINNQKNIVKVLRNYGDLSSFSDKKGVDYQGIPNFSKINTDAIQFNEDTILTDEVPPYIPVIDEVEFKRKGFVFDAIRMGKDSYLLAANGYKEKSGVQPSYVRYREEKKEMTLPTSAENGFVIVTLDQLALISDYYYTKAKGVEIKEAEESNKRAEESYDRMKEDYRAKFLNQSGFYNTIPAAAKKKVTREQYEAMTLAEKEAIYKPFKKYGVKRLMSNLEDDKMYVSFHVMYERFVNPLAVQPKAGVANHEAFVYWEEFRDMMKWKIKDIAMQRVSENETYKIALETSFGESNTSSALKDKYGILVKRQNGTQINPVEIEQIREAWEAVQNTFGGLSDNAAKYNLKISHTGDKYVFASKASGMFVPQMGTIAVSTKFGDNQFQDTLAHETSHWIDKTLGELYGKRWATDDYESTAGQIAFAFRKNLNEKTDSDYTNATKECFARAMEQYFAIENFGDEAMLIFSRTPLSAPTPYFAEKDYVSKHAYTEIIKPLIQKFLKENETFFKYAVAPDADAATKTFMCGGKIKWGI